MKQKKNDRPIPVDGNITPITKREIQSVNATKWEQMSINELYDQRSIIHGRMVIASQMGNPSLIQQLQFGVSQIDALIEKKIQPIEE